MIYRSLIRIAYSPRNYQIFVKATKETDNRDLKFTIKLNGLDDHSFGLFRRTQVNIIASVVEFGSMFLAYQVGLSQLGLLAGFAYAMFDAWLVVWQRERISNLIHRAENVERRMGPFRRRYVLPWAVD